jgi:hypothetical protein
MTIIERVEPDCFLVKLDVEELVLLRRLYDQLDIGPEKALKKLIEHALFEPEYNEYGAKIR